MMAEESGADARLEALEVKAAYQEATIQELSETIYAQDRRLERLERQLSEISAKFKEVLQEGLPQLPPNERPPHY